MRLMGRSVHGDLDGLIVGEAGWWWLRFGGTVAGVATSVASLPPHLPLTRRTPVLAVDHVRLQLAETEAGALRECLQGCLAYAGCVEICTVHVHIVRDVHRTTVEVLSAVERVLHPTHGCLCLDRASSAVQYIRSRFTRT